MRRTDLELAKIKEFEKRIDKCEEYKEELIEKLQNLKNKLLDREMNYYEYDEIFNKKHDKKTISEWIEYYD